MKSKTIKLVSGVAILAAVSGAYLGISSYVVSREEKESQAADTSVSVIDVDTDKISSVEYTSMEGDPVIFERNEDSWNKKEEPDFPVDQASLDNAVNALAVLDADRELADPGALSEYDLDKPQSRITLSTEDGEEISIDVGMQNPSTNQYYVKKPDAEEIYLVPSTSLDSFMGTAYDFAETEAFPTITSATITDVKVEKKNSYQLMKNDASLFWYVSDGKTSEKADTTKAGNVTSAIGALIYEELVDYNCTDPAKYGFDDPYAVITASYLEEEETEADTDAEEASEEEDASSETEEETETVQTEKQIVIYVGNKTEESRYVKVNDSSQVYTISDASFTEILDKNASDFYSLSVNYLSEENLETLEIQDEEGSHTVEVTRTEITEEASDTENKSEEISDTDETDSEDTSGAAEETDTEVSVSYTLDGRELDETKFSTFYNKLINMTAQERLTEDYTPKSDPAYTFIFTDINSDKTTVSYYEYDPSFYAAVVEDKIYLVNKMNVKDLIEAYETMLTEDEAASGESSEYPEETSDQ